MRETFPGRYVEQDPDVEAEMHLGEVFRLLAKIVEQTGDLSAVVKRNIRAQIQAHLDALGVESLEDYEKLAEIYARIDERKRTLPNPSDYPEKDLFLKNLIKLNEGKGKERVPDGVMDPLYASDIAAHGQANWSQIEGRGEKTALDYLYDLGKVMTSRLAYGAVFDPTDAIQVGKSWNIENGRHRALTLRVLGSNYVGQKGMDNWVVVKKEGLQE